MEIRRVGLEACADLTGTVVAVDVLRSFTTAAFAVAAGAGALHAADGAQHARELIDRIPGALTIGSLPGGAPIQGFDLPNSPARLVGRALASRKPVRSYVPEDYAEILDTPDA